MSLVRAIRARPSCLTMSVERPYAALSVAQDGSRFLKTRSVFYASPQFVKVYEVAGGIATELIYGIQWSWNVGVGSRIGVVADLVDGIKLISPVVGRSYRLVVQEADMLVEPTLYKWRQDGQPVKRRGIPARQSRYGAAPVLLQQISMVDEFTYVARYGSPVSITDTFRFADRVSVSWWDRGVVLPAGMRIELYHFGKQRSSAGQRVDSVVVPVATYTTNSINLGAYPFVGSRYISGVWWVRVRDTNTNAVTPWALQKIRVHQYGVWSPGYATLIGRYRRRTLIS